MTLVRPTTVLAGTLGASAVEPRWRLALTGMQIARTPEWSKKPFVLRNVPYTAVMPKPKQIAVRVVFGRLAGQAKGQKKTGFLPPAAEVLQKAKGQIASRVASIPSQRDERRSFATLSQREAQLRELGYSV
jgi:hypothetical protein